MMSKTQTLINTKVIIFMSTLRERRSWNIFSHSQCQFSFPENKKQKHILFLLLPSPKKWLELEPHVQHPMIFHLQGKKTQVDRRIQKRINKRCQTHNSFFFSFSISKFSHKNIHSPLFFSSCSFSEPVPKPLKRKKNKHPR
ncbi:hypothetical protein AAHE18_15G221500 [Arachis hypogaea]